MADTTVTPILETTTTSKATGEAATQPVPPAPDDNIRGKLAGTTIASYGIFISLVVWLLVFHSDKISPVVATLLGTITGAQASNVSAVYQYYYGSSSGSTAKDKRP